MYFWDYLVLLVVAMIITAFAVKISEIFDDGIGVLDIIAAICLTILFVMIASTLFIIEPSEENYSKKEILESQKIEVILDSENGTCGEAVLKDHTAHEGTIVYTSDKSLDKTYQKVRYYNSFFYNESSIIYLYDPEKALANNK
jgi:hypothetical protein